MTDTFKEQNSEWVSFNSELTRKLSEQTTKWATSFDQGKISARELFIVTNALWYACSGLVDEKALRIVEHLNKAAREAVAAERRA